MNINWVSSLKKAKRQPSAGLSHPSQVFPFSFSQLSFFLPALSIALTYGEKKGKVVWRLLLGTKILLTLFYNNCIYFLFSAKPFSSSLFPVALALALRASVWIRLNCAEPQRLTPVWWPNASGKVWCGHHSQKQWAHMACFKKEWIQWEPEKRNEDKLT